MNPEINVPEIPGFSALSQSCDCLLPSVEVQCQNTGAAVLVSSSCCVVLFDALQINPDNPEVKAEVLAFPWAAPLCVFLAFNASACNAGLHFGHLILQMILFQNCLQIVLLCGSRERAELELSYSPSHA